MIFLFLLMMMGVAHADVYVITAPDKSVYSISEADDAVVPSGYKKDIVKNKKIKDLTVSLGEENLYDFNNGTFTVNAKKIQDKSKAESDYILKVQKEENSKKSAMDKLKALGLTEDEAKSLVQ